MRKIPALALLAPLLVTPAAAADRCGPLAMVNSVHMTRIPGSNVDIVPVTINGAEKNFLLDTGGNVTQIQRAAAEALKLPISHDGLPLYSLTGTVSRDMASVRQFGIGRMRGDNVRFPISPIVEVGVLADGILAPDYLESYDADMDFGNDTLNLFSPNHCPGGVVYWKASAVTTIAMSRQGSAIIVPVMLDGRPIKAMLDTGSTYSALRMDIAQRNFGLTMGTDDTPENGGLNGDVSVKTYRHVFKNLSFGGVEVGNPAFVIIPNAAGRKAERAPTTSRTRSEKDLVNTPELIIGMDVLRKLHVYLAFREKKIYISPASVSSPPMPISVSMPPLTLPQRAAFEVAYLNTQIAARPDDAELFNRRCFMRGLTGKDLDAALADCDQALRLKPGTIAFLDRRALILYLQKKYRAARGAYDDILKTEPDYPAALLMRGYAKGRLGDRAGRDADIAAAKAGNPSIEANYQRIGINR